MRQDLMLSLLLHFLIVTVMIVGTPFKPKVKTDLSNVIQVSLASLPSNFQLGQQKAAPIPKAMVPEKTATPVAKNVSKAKPVDKAKKEVKKNNPLLEKGAGEKTGAANGQKDVSSELGAGSAFGGAAVDNASFDYPYWFVQAFSKIERNWSNPVYANQPLDCIIYFQVIRSGRIIEIQIEQSSGFDAFDRACQQAVQLAAPLPPLPSEFTDEIIGIHLDFPYRPQ